MAEHSLFYYPYASFTNTQLPLLKVAALYFDKLYILDPVGASWDTIGADFIARDAILLLKEAGILEIVMPQTVLEQFSSALEESIRQDMGDLEFLTLCETHSQASNKQSWALSLAKVPENLQTDQAMRHLLGDFARTVSSEAGQYREQFITYAETGQVYNEYREGYNSDREYRYAEFPLALGEAIMMNHALFTGLLHKGATPITDDPFHHQALSHKLSRALQDPLVQQTQSTWKQKRQLTADLFAATALTDTQLNLPILNPQLPLHAILDYRNDNSDALQSARGKLGWMARRIESEPWTKDFAEELEHKTIPDLADQLDEARKARKAGPGRASHQGPFRPLALRQPGLRQGPDRAADRKGGGAGPAPGGQGDGAQIRDPQTTTARQTGRLRPAECRGHGDLHRRGRQRRGLRQAGPQPGDPGHPAAAGQDPECGARALRQDALLRGDRDPDRGTRHRHRAR